jgi:Ser-tRNA(Ala) deacylase AlaX
MTDRLYQRDSYLKTFAARITTVQPEGVILDRTSPHACTSCWTG